MLRRDPPPPDWQDDARSGLNVDRDPRRIAQPIHAGLCAAGAPAASAEGKIDLGELVRRVASSGNTPAGSGRCRGPEISIVADAAQIEQLLINILHNAVEASLETGGDVAAGWRELAECVEVFVRDEGPGIMNPTNLFVPFFTTKPGGSGIGLTLSRQIAEAHGGSLTLVERRGRSGCEALLRLPR